MYIQPYLEKCTETFDLSAASASSTDNSCFAQLRQTFLNKVVYRTSGGVIKEETDEKKIKIEPDLEGPELNILECNIPLEVLCLLFIQEKDFFYVFYFILHKITSDIIGLKLAIYISVFLMFLDEQIIIRNFHLINT